MLRAALTRGRRDAAATAAGIVAGLFVWGAAAAVGVSALLTASQVAYDVLRYAGAAYLVWFGLRLLVRAVRAHAAAAPQVTAQQLAVARGPAGAGHQPAQPEGRRLLRRAAAAVPAGGQQPLAVGRAGRMRALISALVRRDRLARRWPPAAPASTAGADGVTGTWPPVRHGWPTCSTEVAAPRAPR